MEIPTSDMGAAESIQKKIVFKPGAGHFLNANSAPPARGCWPESMHFAYSRAGVLHFC